MQTAEIILWFMAMLVLAIVLKPFSEWLKLPFSLTLVVGGYVGSEAVIAAGIDTGLRWHHFHTLIFNIFLPLLIFEAALNIKVRLLLRNLLPILILAIPVMVLSTLITAALLYAGIAHPTGFPWIAALLTGALLSATDPAAVLDLFKKAGAPERLQLLLDGESLFNDGTAIVLFTVFMSAAITGADQLSVNESIRQFARIFFGGIGLGLVVGGISYCAFRLLSDDVLRGISSLIASYSAFMIAEHFFHVSGVMAILVTGVLVGLSRDRFSNHNVSTNNTFNNKVSNNHHDFIGKLWEFNGFIATAAVFLLVGVTLQISMFTEQWLAILIGIGAVLIARAVGVFGVVPLISRLPGIEPISFRYQQVIFWGGLRGAVSLALALSLPLELDYWFTIQSVAYGVVFFTLFVQATTITPLIKKAS